MEKILLKLKLICCVWYLACCERPRRKGAALTNTDIQADDIIKDIKFTYDSKRHNWNGYVKKKRTNNNNIYFVCYFYLSYNLFFVVKNPDDYMEIVRDREKIEEKRKE